MTSRQHRSCPTERGIRMINSIRAPSLCLAQPDGIVRVKFQLLIGDSTCLSSAEARRPRRMNSASGQAANLARGKRANLANRVPLTRLQSALCKTRTRWLLADLLISLIYAAF